MGKVVTASYKVQDGLFRVGLEGVQKHAVDGKVAADYVFAGVGGEANGFWSSPVEIGAIVAEGRDFRGGRVVQHQNDAEVRADLEGARKERGDLFRGGAGGDVKVCWRQVEQHIADASASQIRGMAGIAQRVGDMSCGL